MRNHPSSFRAGKEDVDHPFQLGDAPWVTFGCQKRKLCLMFNEFHGGPISPHKVRTGSLAIPQCMFKSRPGKRTLPCRLEWWHHCKQSASLNLFVPFV